MRLPRFSLNKNSRWFDWLVVLSIFVIVMGVFSLTYVPGTRFLGWDTVASELNLSLAWKRALFGVWQEFQGVGLLGGHGYVTDLVRLPLLTVLSWFLPNDLIRYVMTFWLWWWGAVGAYVLGIQVFSDNKNKWFGRLAALVVAVGYLLHPFTLQNFYVLHDAFGWLYAWLPWVLWGLWGFLLKPTKGKALIWLLLSFVFSFAGFIPPVMVGFGLVLALILLVYGLAGRGIKTWRKSAIAGLLFIVANLYWLLPFTYYSLTQANTYIESKLNQESTPENIYKSAYYGTIEKVATGQGFYFGSLDVTNELHTVPIMGPWEEWTKLSTVRLGMWSLFLFGIVGWIIGLVRWRTDWRLAIPLIGLGSLLVMASSSNVLAPIWQGLRLIPIINQAFRIPFTKFSFFYTLFISLGWGACIWSVGQQKKMRLGMSLSLLLTVVMVVVIGMLAKPIFQGQFLYGRLKPLLPKAYEHLFEELKQMPKQQRLAVMPVGSYNGWQFTDWGYSGSGFLFYGIQQPTLDRAFDVWSPYNEEYLREMSRAIYGNDYDAFKLVINKYQIALALIDESVTTSDRHGMNLKIAETKNLLVSLGAKLVWQEDFLSLYQMPTNVGNSFISEDYLELEQNPIFNLNSEETNGLKYENGTIIIEGQIDQSGLLKVPGLTQGTRLALNGTVQLQDKLIILTWEPIAVIETGIGVLKPVQLEPIHIPLAAELDQVLIQVGDNNLRLNQGETVGLEAVSAEVGKEIPVWVFDITKAKPVQTESILTNESVKCWERLTGGEVVSVVDGNERVLRTRDASACISLPLGRMENTGIVKISLPYRSIDGSRPHFCLVKEGIDYECLNEDVFYQTGPSESGAVVERYVKVDSSEAYWLDVVARPPDMIGGEWSIVYKQPTIEYFANIQKISTPNNYWTELATEKSMPIDKGDDLVVRMTTMPRLLDWEKMGKPNAENCDLFKRGEVGKSGITYWAKDRGAACDLAVMDTLSNQQEYVMRWVGENISGRSLKIYVLNKASEHNDLETLLPTGKFDTSFRLLAWPRLKESWYDISLETRSFGREKSENRIDQVAFYPVPLSWISKIRVVPVEAGENMGGFGQYIEGDSASTSASLDGKLVNDLEIKNVRKYGTSHYVVDTRGQGLLALSQGFDNSWVAFANRKKLDHVKVNGWSNGWLVPEGGTIIIIFWPQYLEWIGIGMLVIFSMGMIFWKHGLPKAGKVARA